MMQEMNGMKCTDKHMRILSRVIAVTAALMMVLLLSGCEQKTDDSTISVKALQEKCGTFANFVLSSGCDIPASTPWENIEAFFSAAEGK